MATIDFNSQYFLNQDGLKALVEALRYRFEKVSESIESVKEADEDKVKAVADDLATLQELVDKIAQYDDDAALVGGDLKDAKDLIDEIKSALKTQKDGAAVADAADYSRLADIEAAIASLDELTKDINKVLTGVKAKYDADAQTIDLTFTTYGADVEDETVSIDVSDLIVHGMLENVAVVNIGREDKEIEIDGETVGVVESVREGIVQGTYQKFLAFSFCLEHVKNSEGSHEGEKKWIFVNVDELFRDYTFTAETETKITTDADKTDYTNLFTLSTTTTSVGDQANAVVYKLTVSDKVATAVEKVLGDSGIDALNAAIAELKTTIKSNASAADEAIKAVSADVDFIKTTLDYSETDKDFNRIIAIENFINDNTIPEAYVSDYIDYAFYDKGQEPNIENY
jgi:hypothetical protein